MSGKRDRPKHFDIDQKTLEYKKAEDQEQDLNLETPDKIAQRKIFKIKRPNQGEQNKITESASKPKFTMFQNTQGQDNQNADKEIKPQKKELDKKQQHTQKSEANNSQKSKQEPLKKAENKSLFNAGSIFGSGPTFLGNGIGIFTNNSLNKDSIFSKNSTFGAKDSKLEQKDNKQPSAAKASGSLFGTGQSIFNFSNNGVPPIKKQVPGSKPDQQDDDGDSEELQKDQKLEIDKSKSTGKYEYKSQCELLFQNKAIKVKKHNGEIVENIEVIVQQDSTKTISWLVIRLAATKNSILTGHLVKGKSQVKKIGNKDQNVTLSVFVKSGKQHQCNILKIQFEKSQQGKKFIETVEKIIK